MAPRGTLLKDASTGELPVSGGIVKPIRRILVPIKDSRARSLPAVVKAAQLAKAFGARVQLFHGVAERLYVNGADLQGVGLKQLAEERCEEYRAQLEAIAKRLRRRGIEVATAVEWDFPAHEAILRAARRFGADLIVLDAHPTAHRAPWLLRFTDWELLRLAEIPVLLVKQRTAYRRPKILAAIDPSHAFAKPAKLDDSILSYGSQIAGALHGTLHAVHAFDPMPVTMVPSQLGAPEAFPQLQARIAAAARADLKRALRSRPIPPGRCHLIGRHPIDAIEQVAREIDSSIVVMGAISRSGLKRFIIGNTAEKVLDEVACDLLIVKPGAFRSHVGRTSRGARIVPLNLSPGLI
jgi:universal stress protein E